ncbi:hypothetical protein ASD06_09475 [Angustibacter sp. Root456]|nr:hypothetical protein ASD06_09475 [Angustibacter sp. Root456]
MADGHTMRVTMQKLAEICRRAGLTVTSVAEDLDEVHCVHDRWPDGVVSVAADGAVLEGALSGAAADVEYLWPGRDPEDGAMALLSTSLHAVLDARFATPTRAVLGGSLTWEVTPPEQFPQRGRSPGPAHWEAPRRDRHR